MKHVDVGLKGVTKEEDEKERIAPSVQPKPFVFPLSSSHIDNMSMLAENRPQLIPSVMDDSGNSLRPFKYEC